MKYLKFFENKELPEIGDCALVLDPNHFTEELNIFLKNKIGKILEIQKLSVFIQYEDVPRDIDHYFQYFKDRGYKDCRSYVIDKIIYSKSKEELEYKLLTKKYNI